MATIPITPRALRQRIDRALVKQGRVIQQTTDFGFCLIDTKQATVIRKHVDLEKLGRELAAIKPWEKVT